MQTAEAHRIRSLEALEALYGGGSAVSEASRRKEVGHLHPAYRAWIEAAPFCVLATAGPGGLDASPRGDAGACVAVHDAHTVLLPDRRGNNRIDSLRNIVADPRVALLFLVPGAGETLRVNGRAEISTEPALLERFTHEGARPRCVLVVQVETAFFQCARALRRAGLWDAANRPAVPSAGAMLAALTDGGIDGAAYDRELPGRQAATLY
jgi:uncharacterized protein